MLGSGLDLLQAGTATFPRKKEMENTKKITQGMTDRERYKILKKKVLRVPSYNPIQLPSESEEIRQLQDAKSGVARTTLKKLAEEFALFDTYRNDDIELSFNVSSRTLKESVSKQKHGFENMAKLMTCFGAVVENAIGIEAHADKRVVEDSSLKNMYVLLGAFQDEKAIIPVKMEVKELRDAPNKLYMYVSLYPIEKVAVDNTRLDRKGSSRALATFDKSIATLDTISIPQLVKNINPLDEDFLKYCPDMMLDEAQQAAKYHAIEEDKKKMKNKESLSIGSGRDPSTLPKGAGTSKPAPAAPNGGNVNKNTKKNAPKKGGFWGL